MSPHSRPVVMAIEVSARPRQRSQLVWGMLWALISMTALPGCGAERYEERLRNTAEYFAYKNKLNEALGPDWQSQGVRIRLPKQFREIPPPPPAVESDDGSTPEVEDARQPQFLGVRLPGLLGAFQADVRADVGGAEESTTSWLYILGNHERYLEGPDESGVSEDPDAFLADVENLLSGISGVLIPEGEGGDGTQENMRYGETAPQVEKFAQRRRFTGLVIKPEIAIEGLELPAEMQLYEWRGQKIQVLILLMYPASISPQEHLHDRLLLALETFDAKDEPPRSGAGGGQPSAGAATGF